LVVIIPQTVIRFCLTQEEEQYSKDSRAKRKMSFRHTASDMKTGSYHRSHAGAIANANKMELNLTDSDFMASAAESLGIDPKEIQKHLAKSALASKLGGGAGGNKNKGFDVRDAGVGLGAEKMTERDRQRQLGVGASGDTYAAGEGPVDPVTGLPRLETAEEEALRENGRKPSSQVNTVRTQQGGALAGAQVKIHRKQERVVVENTQRTKRLRDDLAREEAEDENAGIAAKLQSTSGPVTLLGASSSSSAASMAAKKKFSAGSGGGGDRLAMLQGLKKGKKKIVIPKK
jgi:hypothetical protein